ncbi:MAG: phosphoenolpyruvate--protein phosphotransferase, partial [Spirochaetales bacterium]|nr:phosphoenolpyruvate--protein phosphotransferase [Spirochaetales bacterium]
MISIQGKGVSNGVALGPLYFYQRAKSTVTRTTVTDTDAEWARFKDAQQKAMEQLGELAEKARREAGDEAALLFETHQMMAEDLDYEEAIQTAICDGKLNAEAAVSDTAEQFAQMFATMDDPYMQARAADVKDVSGRIIGILAGVAQGGIDSPVPVILAADDLAPGRRRTNVADHGSLRGIRGLQIADHGHFAALLRLQRADDAARMGRTGGLVRLQRSDDAAP